jgi:flavin-dependent amine oxidoreductase
MHTRRQVLRGGLGLFALGAAGPAFGTASRALGAEPDPHRLKKIAGLSEVPIKGSRPLAARAFDPKPRMIDGFPIKNWFEGDDFNDGLNIPFHSAENVFPGGQPPEPTERVQVAVVGGGLSGLACGYLLSEYSPVVFELHPQFGGNAQGGIINGSAYSLGSAYVITPDAGSTLDNIYRDLGLHDIVRVDDLPAPVEINGEINDDVWSGVGASPEDQPAYEAYRQLVIRMAEETYPDVPFDQQWMLDLDRLSFKEHIEQEVGLAIPAALQAAIQAYCYASFCAGWEEISAASGWNFLAAEEYGRWVFPGGNAWMADQMWQRINATDATDTEHAPHLRAGCRVVDVRVQADGLALVTWRTPDGEFKSLLADRVIMATPKHVARKILFGLEEEDPEKFDAMVMFTRPYVVANVVLDRDVPDTFYDIFTLDNPDDYPGSAGEATEFWRFTDVTNGSFTPMPPQPGLPKHPGILTLYWPLSYDSARFDLVLDDPILAFGEALAEPLRRALTLLDIPDKAVREVRFSRWGHAVPISRVGFIADGLPGVLMRPYKEAVLFVNQDNWALPAVENSLLDAVNAADAIAKFLG